MKTLGRLLPSGYESERFVELRQITHFDHNVKFSQPGRAEPQLSPREAPARDQSSLMEMAHIGGDLLAEHEVADVGLQVAPYMIKVQSRPPPARRLQAWQQERTPEATLTVCARSPRNAAGGNRDAK
jgi:hypothetical protein